MNKDSQDIDLIEKYFRGELNASAMHNLEKRALEDPFLAEAMEGYENFPHNSNSLNELKVRLKSRVDSKPQKTEQPFNLRLWSIAACVVILIGLFSIYLNQPKETNFAEPITKSTPRIPAPAVIENKDQPTEDEIAAEPIEEIISKAESVALSKQKITKDTTPVSDDIIIEQLKKPEIASSIIASTEPSVTITQKEGFIPPEPLAGIASSNAVSARLTKESDTTATKGRIRDLTTAKAINGVVVKDLKTNVRVVTNENGEFFFPYKVNKIGIYATGYQNREIELGPLHEININLNPATSTQQPIRNIRRGTVVGPSDGWAAFRKYLNENNELESGETGHVIVEFIIKPSGELSDFKILKSLSKLADARAIDLVKNYQYWQGSSDGYSNRVKVTVRFK